MDNLAYSKLLFWRPVKLDEQAVNYTNERFSSGTAATYEKYHVIPPSICAMFRSGIMDLYDDSETRFKLTWRQELAKSLPCGLHRSRDGIRCVRT